MATIPRNPLADANGSNGWQTAADDIEIVIEKGRAFRRYWLDLWQYRELFYFLAWRDVLVRYKQTVIGVAWALFRPLVTMLAFTFVFGRLGKFPSEGVPYPVLVFTALLPWQFYASGLDQSSTSLIENSNMLSKVYFPRIILPASAVLVCLVDFLVSFILLLVLMVCFHVTPTIRVVTLPVFLLLAGVAALGGGLWLSALNVRYRDFRYVVPFLIQAGLFISPVGFASSVVPGPWRLLYSVNPMVGVIDGFRWAMLGGSATLYWPGLLLSTILSLLIFLTGISYFRRMERTFADVI